MWGNDNWTIIGAVTSAAVLVLYILAEFLKPAIRHLRLKRPCKTHFPIRSLSQAEIPYVVQDDDMHSVRELVLPARSELEIEIGYWPRLPYYEVLIIFQCEGDPKERPFALERFQRFIKVGKDRWIPGRDDTDKISVADSYEIRRDSARNTGTHFVLGFKIKTRAPGVYPANLYFVTDEVEGRSSLTLRVEDIPRTTMRCSAKGHWGCFVRPNPAWNNK